MFEFRTQPLGYLLEIFGGASTSVLPARKLAPKEQRHHKSYVGTEKEREFEFVP